MNENSWPILINYTFAERKWGLLIQLTFKLGFNRNNLLDFLNNRFNFIKNWFDLFDNLVSFINYLLNFFYYLLNFIRYLNYFLLGYAFIWFFNIFYKMQDDNSYLAYAF